MRRCSDVVVSAVVLLVVVVVQVVEVEGQGAGSMTVVSSKDIERFVNTDLSTNLQKYIQHEGFRLRVISNDSRHEDEVPLVKQRLEEFKIVHQDLVKNHSANHSLKQMSSHNHPTSVFAVIRNYLDALGNKMDNVTLYGSRMKEFLIKNQKFNLPTKDDLFRASAVITFLQRVHNISRSDILQGQIKGHQGEPLNAADCYYIGKVSFEAKLVDEAIQWTRMALKFTDLNSATIRKDATFNVTDALVVLATALMTKEEKEEAISLLEKATEIDPDNMHLHSMYLKNRFGRETSSMENVVVDHDMERFFQLCANITAGNTITRKTRRSPRLTCRHKHHRRTPYWRYREEIISKRPFISVIHDFIIGDGSIDRVLNVSLDKPFSDVIMPGGLINQLWQSKTRRIPDFYSPVISDVSKRVSYVTGLSTRQKKGRIFLGEPAQVIDFGPGGTYSPHREMDKVYPKSHMGEYGMTKLITFTLFLSDTDEGGHLVFPELNITVAPRKGMAVYVYNQKPSSIPEPDLQMAMCPVIVGRNVVIQKGIFSTGLDQNVLCGRKVRSTYLSVEKARGCVAGPCGAPNHYKK